MPQFVSGVMPQFEDGGGSRRPCDFRRAHQKQIDRFEIKTYIDFRQSEIYFL